MEFIQQWKWIFYEFKRMGIIVGYHKILYDTVYSVI